MKNDDGILSEILPFLQDLFPVISNRPLLTNVLKILLVAVGSVLFIFLAIFITFHLIEKNNAKKYLRSIQIFKDIESSDFQPEMKDKLFRLLERCVILGARIDFHTGRKNNSRMVSKIVYDIAKIRENSLLESVLKACSAMVYDAGFLSMNPFMFRAEILSAKEKNLLKKHIMYSEDYFDFIPAEYLDIFRDAAMFHHENYNGSGYPEGLFEKDIPETPRIIRIVESYVSLTSKRSYHKPMNQKKALSEIYGNSQFYDMQIFDCMKKVI